MKKYLLLSIIVIILFGSTGFIWACPGGDPYDNGICDTIYAICYDTVKVYPPPWEVHFSILITNDILDPITDSIIGFVIPLEFTHTNPSAYCSLLYRKNTISYTDTVNSVLRHFGGMQNRLMGLYEEGYGEEWDNVLFGVSNWWSFWIALYCSVIPNVPPDRAWWEGSRTLLATFTFIVEDTMTVCMDSLIMEPFDDIIRFIGGDDQTYTYIPRIKMPCCVRIRGVKRGDANGDQVINIADVLYMINYLFRHGTPPVCFESGDANCDNDHGILDVALLINYLYKGGPPPGCP